ncbi:hypothetical protein NMG60_11008438 [Bertholletia excelsa]
MEQLQHESHDHRLIFIEELEDDGVRCDGCGESISGPCYSCDICKYFLHKSCAKLPLEISHPVHPHHTLQIYYRVKSLPCFSCKRVIEGFFYGCKDCLIPLDINCSRTSLLKVQQRISHRTHSPPVYISKLAIFSCDACGVKHEGKFYLCTTCNIMVNETCHASPKSFKHNDHEHDLFLADCLPFEDFRFLYKCEICRETLSREYWIYYCKKCLYFIHLKCAKSETKLSSASQLQIDEANLITLPPPYESIDPITLFMKKISGHGNYKIVIEFNHPSHQGHPLILSVGQSKASVWNNARHIKQCNGCALPILGPFYHCAECGFILHEWCARLPNELQHPSHPKHTLELDTKPSIWGERCEICMEQCNIFMYRCSTCGYKIDCKCASLPSTIKHEAHNHTLVWQKVKGLIYCSLYEFYCEICEEEIDPKICFYHCVVCDQSTHPQCISPPLRYPNWKFENNLKANIHPHMLNLVDTPKKSSKCEMCKGTWQHPSYECETCSFWLHLWCVKKKRLQGFVLPVS